MSWPAANTGWTLQATTNGVTSAEWVDIKGTTTTNSRVTPAVEPSPSLFRLRLPEESAPE